MGGNHKKKGGDKVGTESSTRRVELMDSSLDGSKENGKKPINVPNLSNGMADEGEQRVPNANVNNSQRSFASLVINKADTKVNFRSLETDKPINAKAEVKIPKVFWKLTRDLALACMFASIEGMNEDKLHDILIVAFNADEWSAMATKIEDYKEVLHTMRVKYDWKPPRRGMCMIFRHDNLSCTKRVIDKPKKQHTTCDGFQQPPRHTSHGTNVGGTKKNYEVPRHETNLANPFDALNMIKNDDELGSNGGSYNELESQMLVGKLVLVGEDGKPLKPCKSTLPTASNVTCKKVDDPVNEDMDNVNTSGNKEKDAESRKEVSNPNLFDVLNSVENDVHLGTNGGTLNLASLKLEKLIIDGKISLVDDEGKPPEKVAYLGDHDSENEPEIRSVLERDRVDLVRDVAMEMVLNYNTIEVVVVGPQVVAGQMRSTLRPDDILVFGWAGGKHSCVDLTGVSLLNTRKLRDNGFVAGQAALKAESSKVAKHEKACFENQHVFIPFAFDTFGFLAPEAEEFLTRVQRVVQSDFLTPKTQNFIFSRICFAIQNEVAAQLVARLPAILL
ncbi:hypothetical protein Tco_1362796 [Tanacetum coccineum]